VTDLPRPSLASIGTLTFEEPDMQRFRSLALARSALSAGGNMPCALNAANEVAVAAFLQGRIGFPGIAGAVEYVLEKTTLNNEASMSVYEETDSRSRSLASEYISKTPKQ
ncbi:MAG: 1-deoxy-D-xylulose-5-phosphate reductoisomerase, partial [Bacteroidales bacterium]|nr:1-deoxy-D-xylulose-5-phosphate reductoisomerase [Bacteroidales bacterium]